MERGEPSAAASSRVRRSADLVRVASATATAIALGTVIVSSIVLLRRFQPYSQIARNPTVEGVVHYGPRPWVSTHEIALGVASGAVLLWFATTVWLVRGRSRPATVGAVVSAAIATIGTWAAALSWHHVRWNQLGLWAVTVGRGYTGLWKPTDSDQVRFVFTSNGELSPHTYRVALLIHVAAPVVAGLALCTSAYIGRLQRPRPEEMPTEAFHGGAESSIIYLDT